MVVDVHGMSHKAKGLPKGEAGAYEGRIGVNGDDDLDTVTMLAVASMGGRNHAYADRVTMKSPEETQALLDAADRVEITPDGVHLIDENGGTVFRETDLTPPLDTATLRRDRKVRLASRRTLRDPLEGRSEKERKALTRAAWRVASPYDRRNTIDSGPNRRYVPANAIASSLRRRRDQDKAVRTLIDLHYEDARTSAAVIRLGYPNTSHAAWTYINNTKIQRESKDRYDKTGRLIARKGDPINGTYENREGKTITGPLPERKGSTSRAYLRMIYQPTDGVPSGKDAKLISDALRDVGEKDGSKAQAQAFWEICYGNGSPANLRGDVDFAKRLHPRNRSANQEKGARMLNRLRAGHGQGNAARMVAYQKPLSRDAAIRFLRMEPGDTRRARTIFPRRRRDPQTGEMRTVRPKRLTEMRSWIRGVYGISDTDIEQWEKEHPGE